MSSLPLSQPSAGASVDLRGFSYALSPYLAQQQWVLERLDHQTAQAQKALTAIAAQLAELQHAFERHAASLQQQVHQRLDPNAYRRGLAYLVDLQHRVQQCQREHDERRAACEALRKARLAQQGKVDGLEKHRQQAQHDYAQEAARAASAEADRAWIGRRHHLQTQRAASAPGTPS